ncbi:ADP compounds hydrolase NudE [Thiomicrorhabdus sp. 6S3-12]|uniref:ADP compounds hydrolase NudE n=1 Tax=Thiomicrorhabdus sp. 6S3-12 TaxID=2819681 RepID=UPI001AAC966D|nr:ADP compounds hydrolase NudE [Thiomicrorhabdus sp. 6S3-12]MBO1923073.1 ADP compounds hydrolase NudE [Thiomicrorhabdus sp. 6S3-12]
MSQKLPSILAEKIAAKSRIFTVQSQHLAFSNGAEVVYERLLAGGGGAVLIVPVLEDGTLLLIREFGAGVGRYELGFPKGKIDPGEGWKEAAIRESQEEISHLPKRVELLDSVSLAAGYMTHQTHIVLATDLHPSEAPGDEPEPLEVVPWHLDDWQELVAHPDFSEGRAYAALLLVLKHLGKI